METNVKFDPAAPSKTPRLDAVLAATDDRNPVIILASELEYERDALAARVKELEAALKRIEEAPEVMAIDANGQKLVGIARAAMRGTK